MGSHLTRISVVFGTVLLLFATAAAAQPEIVASLDRVQGGVDVVEGESQRTVQGRDGLLLRVGDLVVTKDNAKATIKFRDGSEIRLFSKTSFLVEGGEENAGGERSFTSRLFMKVGSFWANLVRRRQVAEIGTTTATIGIKGTTLRVVERDNRARVALTEGLIDVSNDRGTVELQAGKRIADFTRRDELQTKIEDIPYKIEVRSETRDLSFAGNRPAEAFVTVQLTDIKSGANVPRSGPLYLRSNYDGITYPQAPALDERGFARVPLIFSPPDASDADLNGNIYVWALLDQEEADDTVEGRVLFRFQLAAGSERFEIEAETGEGRRRN